MRLTVIGGGYVGLTAAVCLASKGAVNVTCLEKNPSRVKQLQAGMCPIREPGLDKLLKESLTDKTIAFTTHAQDAVKNCSLFLIAVGTPESKDGFADLSALRMVSEEIGKYLDQDAVVIIKSTIPPGCTNMVRNWIQSACCKSEINVETVYNPEFLREGSSVSDFLHPERVIIGSDSTKAAQQTADLYRRCLISSAPFLFTSPQNAELIKYASNSFLAMKVAFVNELAHLCGTIGGQIDVVSRGIGMDSRIGSAFLHAGPGYGGACLPKDVRSLTTFARMSGVPLTILEQVDRSNSEHQQWLADTISKELPVQATIAVWGLTFKANTDDLRNSPSLSLIRILSECGNYNFRLYDPTVHSQRIDPLKDIAHLCFTQPEDAICNSDALLIAVPWSEFRIIPLDKLVNLMQGNKVFDLCETWSCTDCVRQGIYYWGLGKGTHKEDDTHEQYFA